MMSNKRLKNFAGLSPIPLFVLSLVLLTPSCTETRKTAPIVAPTPTTPPPGGAGATDGLSPDQTDRPSDLSSTAFRSIFVISRQKLAQSSVSKSVQNQILQNSKDFVLTLASDPPIISSQTNFPELNNDEALWSVTIPPFQGTLLLTVQVVQATTKIPILLSQVKLEQSQHQSSGEQRFTLDWQKPISGPQDPLNKEPKVGLLQKWNGLQDQNGQTLKVKP